MKNIMKKVLKGPCMNHESSHETKANSEANVHSEPKHAAAGEEEIKAESFDHNAESQGHTPNPH